MGPDHTVIETNVPAYATGILALLRREFEVRRARNQKYSLRAFARFLTISAATLSNIMTEKREVSPQMALLITGKLARSRQERLRLIEGIFATTDDEELAASRPASVLAGSLPEAEAAIHGLLRDLTTKYGNVDRDALCALFCSIAATSRPAQDN